MVTKKIWRALKALSGEEGREGETFKQDENGVWHWENRPGYEGVQKAKQKAKKEAIQQARADYEESYRSRIEYDSVKDNPNAYTGDQDQWPHETALGKSLLAAAPKTDPKKVSQQPAKKDVVEEEFQSVPGVHDLLEYMIFQGNPEYVVELFCSNVVTGLTADESKDLLKHMPKEKEWAIVKRYIQANTVNNTIIRPAQKSAGGRADPAVLAALAKCRGARE